MDATELRGTGLKTSRIGLGCGRLVGGTGLNQSRAIVERALELGIRYFDVAPSYGLGLAEDVLAKTLPSSGEFTIATKVGIGRPSGGASRALARTLLRPVVAVSPKLKQMLARRLQSRVPRNQFDRSQVLASLAESLRYLRREWIDILLLHEASPDDITDDLQYLFDDLRAKGTISAYGASTSGRDCDLPLFGDVRQHRWSPAIDGSDAAPVNLEAAHVLHGVLRHGMVAASGRNLTRLSEYLNLDLADPAVLPGALLTAALVSRPNAVVLVSSNDPDRLECGIQGIDWSAVRGENSRYVDTFRELFRSDGV